MTPAEATVVEIIKWAINPEYPVPQIEYLPEELLMDRVIHHRIVGPLLSRLDTARPSWCPPRIRTQFRLRQHRTRTTVQAQIAAAREISRTMSAHGLPPPLFVKGFAAYALTGNPDTLHDSSDLDPFAEDLPAFESVLRELGYTGKRKDHDNGHEWAEFQRDGIALDVHQFFPVMVYPDNVCSLLEEQQDVRRNPGQGHLLTALSRAAFRDAQIRWSDLSTGAGPGAVSGTEEIWFPSPEALCLIHCAHGFRQCMVQTQHMDVTGTFRLYELLSVYHLARLPNFDADQFSVLAERVQAQDAVNFINVIAEAILGIKALPEAGIHRTSFQHLLIPERLFFGGWISVQTPEDWLLRREFEPMLERLGLSIVPAQISSAVSRFPRVLTYGTRLWSLQHLEIAWDKTAGTLTVVWHLDHPREGWTYQDLRITSRLAPR